MSAVGDAQKRTQQTPAETLTDTEREALARGCSRHTGTRLCGDCEGAVEGAATDIKAAAVAAALAPIEAAIYAHHGYLPEWARAALAGGGDRSHDCADCADCIHNGNRCCGCYDGECCRAAGGGDRG